MTTVEVFRNRSLVPHHGSWSWRAKAGNGEIIAQSEGYTTKSSAKRGAVRAFPDATVVAVVP